MPGWATLMKEEFIKLRGKKFKQGLSEQNGHFYIEGLSPKFKDIKDLFKWIKNYGKTTNKKTKKVLR